MANPDPETLEPSDKMYPSRILEDQEDDMVPIVAGAPPYADPNDPDAAGNQMFEMEEGQFGGPSQEGDPIPVGGEASASAQSRGSSDLPMTEDDEVDEDALEEKTVPELKDMAKGLEVEGISSMNKGELIDAIVEAHQMKQDGEEAGEES